MIASLPHQTLLQAAYIELLSVKRSCVQLHRSRRVVLESQMLEVAAAKNTILSGMPSATTPRTLLTFDAGRGNDDHLSLTWARRLSSLGLLRMLSEQLK